MKKFRWILLSGLLVTAVQIAQAQPTGVDPRSGPSGSGIPGGPSQSFPSSPDGRGINGGAADAGAISNIPSPANPGGVAPDGSNGSFVPADDAAFGDSGSSSSIPNTGGEPMIAVLAGLSIAGAALAMRRKVTA